MGSKPKIRIELIDNFRGLAMMYVIFIHTLYWMNFFTDERSYFLIEMPFFFTITGMALYFANMDNWVRFYSARIKRILLPYLICATFYAGLNLCVAYCNGKKYDLLNYLVGWWNPFGGHESVMPFLTWALWFVPIYLLIVVMAPGLRKCFQIKYLSLVTPWLLLIGNIFFTFSDLLFDRLQTTLFYAFWVYLGFVYIKHMHTWSFRKKAPICVCCSLMALGMLMCIRGGQMCTFGQQIISFDMQSNKFPPSFIFMSYNLFWIPLLYLLSREINELLERLKKIKLFAWMYAPYQRSCYTVYLYHPLVFLAIECTIRVLGINTQISHNNIVDFIVVLLTVTIGASLLGRYLGRLEHLDLTMFRKKEIF